MIVHWRKNQEYLIIRLYQDLVGDWVVSESRGHLQAHSGHECTRTILTSYLEARRLVLSLNKQNRQLGYKKTATAEEQLGFQFD
ncbi:hypothetical protein [Neptunomonas concharum]|uniref:WGR domain-containing protein n=1 Tax=Neptunomonas concharum TaxID=1031538 RepID=A0A5P1RBY8_9GAMM|nr:hypothetical protein [Neptunomonas concharum]QEQ97174.1 hypothetical protein F0U83_10880 [Neptunomonas concharum]